MDLKVNLPPHIEQAYLAEALSRGISLDDVVKEALVAASNRAVKQHLLSKEEWQRELRAWGDRNREKSFPS